MQYGTQEYDAYTSEFEYEVFEDCYNSIGEDDLHNCIRYRVIEDENYFIDEYEDGCVYAVEVDRIDNFNILEYTARTLIGVKGIEHHAMKLLFKIKK
jgi:hypothetical protein